MFRIKSIDEKVLITFSDNFDGKADIIFADPKSMTVIDGGIQIPAEMLLTLIVAGATKAGKVALKEIDALREALKKGAGELATFSGEFLKMADDLKEAQRRALGEEGKYIKCVCGAEYDAPLLDYFYCPECAAMYTREGGFKAQPEEG